jgi:terminase large subunit-like protein
MLTPDDRLKAIRACWTVGRLDYRLRNSQKQIKKEWQISKGHSRKFYIESTRRLGKSSFLLFLMLEECIKAPKSRWGFFAPVKDGLLDYIQPIIDTALEDCPLDLRPSFNKQRFMLEFSNGSSILFRGSNNQQHRLRRGMDFDGCGVDEARDVDDLQDLIDSVIFPALFSSDGYLIISSTPADTFSHDLYKYRQLAEIEKWLFQCTMQQASVYDPTEFTPERIAEWRRETKSDDVWAREYDCKWIVDSTRIAVAEWKHDYVSDYKRDVFYPFYHHYIGIDWGSKDYTAIIFATWDFRNAFLQVDGELTFAGTDVRSDKIAAQITRKMLQLWGEDATYFKMISDSADPILINELNGQEGMNAVPVYKEKSLEAMLNQFRMLVGMGKVKVSPTCPMTIANLANAVWNKERTALDHDAYAHHFDHLMALVYLTRGLVPGANPIPEGFGFDGIRVIDLNFDKNPKKNLAAQALEEAYKAAQKRRPI